MSQNFRDSLGIAAVVQGRLMPGNIFLVDFNEHRIIEDTELKKRYTEARPYGEFLDQNAFTLHDVVKATAPANDRLAQLSMDDPLFALPATPTVPVVESIDDSSAPVAMDEQSLIGLLPWLRAFGCAAPWFDNLLQGGWQPVLLYLCSCMGGGWQPVLCQFCCESLNRLCAWQAGQWQWDVRNAATTIH